MIDFVVGENGHFERMHVHRRQSWEEKEQELARAQAKREANLAHRRQTAAHHLARVSHVRELAAHRQSLRQAALERKLQTAVHRRVAFLSSLVGRLKARSVEVQRRAAGSESEVPPHPAAERRQLDERLAKANARRDALLQYRRSMLRKAANRVGEALRRQSEEEIRQQYERRSRLALRLEHAAKRRIEQQRARQALVYRAKQRHREARLVSGFSRVQAGLQHLFGFKYPLERAARGEALDAEDIPPFQEVAATLESKETRTAAKSLLLGMRALHRRFSGEPVPLEPSIDAKRLLLGMMSLMHADTVVKDAATQEQADDALKLLEATRNLYAHLHSMRSLETDQDESLGSCVELFWTLWSIYSTAFEEWRALDIVRMKDSLIAYYLSLERSKPYFGVSARERTAEDDAILNHIMEQQGSLRQRLLRLSGQAGVDELDDALERSSSSAHEEMGAVAAEDEFKLAMIHELSVNPEFSFKLGDASSSLYLQLVRSAKRSLIHSFARDFAETVWNGPALETFLVIVGDIRQQLAALVANRTDIIEEIHHFLDTDLLRQRAQHGAFDHDALQELFEFATAKIQQFEAPMRAESTQAQLQEIVERLARAAGDVQQHADAISDAFEFVFDKLEEIRVDVLNYRIGMIRPVVRQHGVEYERDLLARLHGSDSRTRTRAWLESALHSAPSEYVDRSTLHMKNMSAVANLVKHGVFRLVGDSTAAIDSRVAPEVLRLDAARLFECQNRLQSVCVTAMLLSATRQFIAMEVGFQVPQTELLSLKKTIQAILAGDEGSIDDLARAVVDFAAAVCDRVQRPITEAQRSGLSALIHNVIHATNPVHELVTRRVHDALASYVWNAASSGTVLMELAAQHRRAGLGFALEELRSIAALLVSVSSHLNAVHGDNLAEIAKELDESAAHVPEGAPMPRT